LDRLKGCGTIDAPSELTQIKAKAFAPGHFSAAFQYAFQQDWICPMLRIPHNAFVFVGDGAKALILRNEGGSFQRHPDQLA
jgi:hypothetical protein